MKNQGLEGTVSFIGSLFCSAHYRVCLHAKKRFYLSYISNTPFKKFSNIVCEFCEYFHTEFSLFIQVHRWTMGLKGKRNLIPLYYYTEEQRAIRLKAYFKFLFVREPLHRLLSAFKDKFFANVTESDIIDKCRSDIVKSYRPRDYVRNGINLITFPEFIKYYSDQRTRDHHWRQFDQICHPCLVKYDFIGKLENLSEEGPSLLRMAGLSDKVAFPPIHQHTSGDEVLKYYSQIPPDDIKKIGELYVSDFAMFGYEYLGPVKSVLKNFTDSQRRQWSFLCLHHEMTW